MPILRRPLMGFGGGPAAAAKTFEFRTYAESTAATITLPATIQEGDLIVLLDTARNGSGSNPTQVIPAGFTTAHETLGPSYYRQLVTYKKAVASDAGKSITGMTGTTSVRKLVVVFKANAASITLEDVAGTYNLTADAGATIDITASTAKPILVLSAHSCNPTGSLTRAKTYIRYWADASTVETLDRIEDTIANVEPSQRFAWVIANAGLAKKITARTIDSGSNNACGLFAFSIT